jgi:hypothetical protein
VPGLSQLMVSTSTLDSSSRRLFEGLLFDFLGFRDRGVRRVFNLSENESAVCSPSVKIKSPVIDRPETSSIKIPSAIKAVSSRLFQSPVPPSVVFRE